MASPQRDPAASMSLLNLIVEQSLDPGYRAAKEGGGHSSNTIQKVLIMLVCIALAWISTVAAKNLRSESSSLPRATAALAEQVGQAQEAVVELEESNTELEKQIRVEEERLGSFSSAEPSLLLAAAASHVAGPGLIVTISDNFGGGNALIKDSDLRTLTNALWSGGAEAIAIDGQRVGPQTTIRTAGSSILVNLQPISSPYVVEAIGDPTNLTESLQTGAAATSVQNLQDTLGMTITTAEARHLEIGPLAATQLWYANPLVLDSPQIDDEPTEREDSE